MNAKHLAALLAVAGLLGGPALADWDEGDPYKMHYPQMPDPYGWDIDLTWANFAADDWRCTASGPVDGIHFWYSWERDVVGTIAAIGVTIYSDVPADPNDPASYSHPGEPLWSRQFMAGQFTTRLWSDDPTDPQGFYDAGGGWIPNDHGQTWQCNIGNIEAPFFQQAGTIYWLGLTIWLQDPVGSHIGWKTSTDHFMDAAVFWRDSDGWIELYPYFDPQYESLDLAFVITPEPGTLWLLALGGALLLRRR